MREAPRAAALCEIASNVSAGILVGRGGLVEDFGCGYGAVEEGW